VALILLPVGKFLLQLRDPLPHIFYPAIGAVSAT
jgi:hypothetical protein